MSNTNETYELKELLEWMGKDCYSYIKGNGEIKYGRFPYDKDETDKKAEVFDNLVKKIDVNGLKLQSSRTDQSAFISKAGKLVMVRNNSLSQEDKDNSKMMLNYLWYYWGDKKQDAIVLSCFARYKKLDDASRFIPSFSISIQKNDNYFPDEKEWEVIWRNTINNDYELASNVILKKPFKELSQEITLDDICDKSMTDEEVENFIKDNLNELKEVYVLTCDKIKNSESVKKKMQDIEEKNRLKNIKKYADKLLSSKNIILHGAPGTGKTFLAKEIAAYLIDKKTYDKCGNKERIGFVQFHPSYDYSDFVEGLRPIKGATSNDKENGATSGAGTIQFDVCPGTFKIFVNQAKNVYETNRNSKFIFIIDEINRGEISKIFGELFYSIDPGYRGESGKVKTQYANLHPEEDDFYIPENVYIIGTMNDIDRSVDTFDFAMRRRFRFIEVMAKDNIKMLDKIIDESDREKAVNAMMALNKEIEKVPGLGCKYQIGASYFKKIADEENLDFKGLWTDYLEPLLSDYVLGLGLGDGETKTKINVFKKVYDKETGLNNVKKDMDEADDEFDDEAVPEE